jgi:hypothetical protein
VAAAIITPTSAQKILFLNLFLKEESRATIAALESSRLFNKKRQQHRMVFTQIS